MTQTPVREADATEHFAAKLRFETDASDVHAAMHAPDPGFVLVDARGAAAWEQGRIAGALHLPHAEIPAKAPELIPLDRPVVTYCWGPGCNGATRAALAFARLGYQVREMIGGYEYWVREGFPVHTAAGLMTQSPDPLAAPVSGIACAC
jgi:rhodanese-related sulfurtransferase